MNKFDNILKSNWAEYFVAEQLARSRCLVRNVPQGHDIGIDLYCETTKDCIPFLHFFVQVKCSETYEYKKESIEYRANKEDIEYWCKQPVPVFIFLVPDKRKSDDKFPYFIVSPLDFDMGNDSLSQSIKSFLKIEKKSDLDDFLFIEEENDEKNFKKRLVIQTFLWHLDKRQLIPLPKLMQTKYRWYPAGIIKSLEREKMSYTIHDALWRICEDGLLEIFDKDKMDYKPGHTIHDLYKLIGYFKAFERILYECSFEQDYKGIITLGLYYAALNKYDRALNKIIHAIELAEEKIKNNILTNRKHEEENIAGYKKYKRTLEEKIRNLS